jgi:hypothetical protein
MTDRLTLTRALEGSGMESQAAERIATEICKAIAQSTGAISDLAERQGRIAKAFETSGVERQPSEQIAMVIVDLIRQRHRA